MTSSWRRYALHEENRDRVCVLCNKPHRATSTLAKGLFCSECRTPYLDHEDKRVRQAVGRAQRRGLPASLTILEWLRIIGHFNSQCAYCSASFQVIEHITSINNSGGTTRYNCVPGCLSCNRLKDHPLPGCYPISLEKIEQVKQELQRIFS